MFTHIVLLEPKPETTDAEISATLAQVHALQSAIPGIINVESGQNRSANHQNYTYGFVITFQDEADFTAYATHAAHLAVSAELQHRCHNILDCDINQPQSGGPNLLQALKAAYQAFIEGWQKAGKTTDNTTDYV